MRKGKEDKYTIHTSIDNKTGELVKLKCSNCGATLELVDKTHAKCPFCGQVFLIDEAKGTVIDIDIDDGDVAEIKNTLNSTIRAILIFLVVVVFIVACILGMNLAANKSTFSSSDRDAEMEENGDLMRIFCKDIFGKEYGDITEEEFESIRYIRYDFERDVNDSFNVVEYSFTNYEDCASEEEFQDTIQKWSYSGNKSCWPSDFTMFTGLTRIDTRNSLWLSQVEFSKKAKISCVETDDQLSAVSSHFNPENIKVLHIGTQFDDLEGIEDYKNLEELEIECYSTSEEVDISGLGVCTNLKKLNLNFASSYKGLEVLQNLKELKSIYISGVELKDSSFLKEMPDLEEIYTMSGESGDLSMLSYLPNLKRLHFTDSEPIDPSKLLQLEHLEELELEIDEKEDLQSLTQLKSLKSLNLHLTIFLGYQEEPVDVSALAELPYLEEMTLSDFWEGEITGVESILNKSTMKSLYLGGRSGIGSRMKIVLNPELLVDNPSLECLKMVKWENSEKDWEVEDNYDILTHYSNLRKLEMPKCELTNIEFMSGLTNLEVVNVQENEVTDYSPLLSCKKLRKIYVSGNPQKETGLSESVEVYRELEFSVEENQDQE